jgi:hypothetical protein
MMGDPAPVGIAANRARLRRVAQSTFAGTVMEWYDYYLFGLAASLVFNRLFLTELNPQGCTGISRSFCRLKLTRCCRLTQSARVSRSQKRL